MKLLLKLKDWFMKPQTYKYHDDADYEANILTILLITKQLQL